ncbi:MAG: divergent PAP2 family protein [Chloroflexi bacterium]|nr:divergent PAP2 family protein [Chloroflexota bacterium]
MKPTFGTALTDLVHNRALLAPILALVTVQVWKFATALLFWHKFDPSLLWSTGGMPSSHSALVSALAVSIGINAGFSSPIFAVALAMAIVVMYDAAGVRQAAGKQAQKINLIVEELLNGHPLNDERLRELLGHTPFQVAVGALVGVLTGWLLNL